MLQKELTTHGITSASISYNIINQSESVFQIQFRRAEVFQDMSNFYVYHSLPQAVNQALQRTRELSLKTDLDKVKRKH